MKITRITNDFTGYDATIRTKDIPAVSTIKKHLRNSKARDCKSITRMRTNCEDDGCYGDELDLYFGELLINGCRV